MWRIRLLLVPACAAAFVSAAHAADPCSVEDVTIRIAAGGQILLPVEIEGSRRTFILDTGAPASTVREGVAEELGLPRRPIPLDMISGVGGRPFQEVALARAMRAGPVALSDVPLFVEPRTHALEGEPVGLIGDNFLQQTDLEIDLANLRVGFRKVDGCVEAARNGPRTALPLTVAASGHLFVDVDLDGERVSALIDTGASTSLLTLGAAHRLFGLDPGSPGMVLAGTIHGADGGSSEAWRYAFKTLALGPITLDHPFVALMADETRRVHRVVPAGGVAEEGFPEFILGMTELKRLDLLLSPRHKQLFVREASQ